MKILNVTLCLASALIVGSVFASDPKPVTISALIGADNDTATSSDDKKSHDDKKLQKNKADKKEGSYLSDSEITAKVKQKFIGEKLFGKEKISAMGIHVNTKKGIVILTGTVASKEEVDTAVNLAKSVDGVKSVTSKIKVKGTTKKSKL